MVKRTPLRMLGIEPGRNDFTLAMSRYREKHVYPYFRKKGWLITTCRRSKATRLHVATKAKQRGVVYITGASDGDVNTFKGYDEPVFELGCYGRDEVTCKIVHFFACETAAVLGPDFVQNGCLAYFGYDAVYYGINTGNDADQNVLFECDAEIDLAFADGLNATQVYDRGRRLVARRAAQSRAQGKVCQAETLEGNFNALRCPSSGGSAFSDGRARLY